VVTLNDINVGPENYLYEYYNEGFSGSGLYYYTPDTEVWTNPNSFCFDNTLPVPFSCDGSVNDPVYSFSVDCGDAGTFDSYHCDLYPLGQGQIAFGPGCTDSTAVNFDTTASVDDGSCQYPGCTDETATNYNPGANVDDGYCVFCTDEETECTLTLHDMGLSLYYSSPITFNGVEATTFPVADLNVKEMNTELNTYDLSISVCLTTPVAFTCGVTDYDSSHFFTLACPGLGSYTTDTCDIESSGTLF
jgi:hypothetical protein